MFENIMKLQVFLFIFTYVYCGVSSQYALSDLEGIFNVPLIKTVSQMMRKNCRNKNTEFKENLAFMERCYLNIKGKETFCTMFRNNLGKCTQPLVTTLEHCVDSKYHDIPRFGVDLANSTADYICKSKVKKLIEVLHPCLYTIGLEKSNVCLKSFKEIVTNIHKENNITNIKTNICKSLEDTKSCFLEEFRHNCRSKITLDSAVGLYDAIITKPCRHISVPTSANFI